MKKQLILFSAALLLAVSARAESPERIRYQNNMRSVVFEQENIVINTFDGSAVQLSIATVRSLLFTDTEGTTAINDTQSKAEDHLHIAVSASELQVESEEKINALSVITAGGATVQKTTPSATQARLPISSLPAGVYILLVERESGIKAYKFIKQK